MNEFVETKLGVGPRLAGPRTKMKLPVAFPFLLVLAILQNVEGAERRQDIINGKVDCIIYDGSTRTFGLVCSEFNLEDATDFAMDDFITLGRNEIFQGNDNHIILNGVYDGLFRISTADVSRPSSVSDAPVIRRLHMLDGQTSEYGGFLVQRSQAHFIVDSCTSTGKIGEGGGGICGDRCTGHTMITNCASSGDVIGDRGGGIAGSNFAVASEYNYGVRPLISHCHSTGEISANNSGGICGAAAASEDGRITITRSYSTGTVSGTSSGGLCGAWASENSGSIHISNSYSRGDVTGAFAGGILGASTGEDEGTVTVTNVYASGDMVHNDAGAIIATIAEDAHQIDIAMSVYNVGPIVRENEAGSGVLTSEKNSNNLDDIKGTVYCYGSEECWNEITIWKAIPDELPIIQPSTPSAERRHDIINGDIDCIQYDSNTRIFSLVCSEFNLEDATDFAIDDFITLEKHEIFEGNGNHIILNGAYDGLFRISTSLISEPSSLEDAPVVRSLHMIGGELNDYAGFFIQRYQEHFIIDSCTSSGTIGGGSGGICGDRCTGHILITNCSSSGDIVGAWGGGIAGSNFGLASDWYYEAIPLITRCHSTGEISASNSGGICGVAAGSDYGSIAITESYSTGEISGSSSGGLCGTWTSYDVGAVQITNSYSRGDVTGPSAGGIVGASAGEDEGVVILVNVYASGEIVHSDAGGIISTVAADADQIDIKMSVCNGGPIVRLDEADSGVLTLKSNSDNLDDITGKLYCYEDNECWDETTWRAVPDEVPILQPTAPSGDRRQDIINGVVDCIQYDSNTRIFSLVCSELNLEAATDFTMDDFITLEKNEIFEGNDNHIILDGVYNGLFRISSSAVSRPLSLEEAPVIRSLHMIGGEVSEYGGFFVQRWQANFKVDSCTSSGAIGGGSGGICGDRCTGHILVTNCSSSGDIVGAWGGGIAGSNFGVASAWHYEAIPLITRCHSTGEISASHSGGICGAAAGSDYGSIAITESYSTGEINGSLSGGLCGAWTSYRKGRVQITNSYSQGDITGASAGGIVGADTGEAEGTVIVSNVYASGEITHFYAGAIIANIHVDADQINITKSVYNGEPIVRENNADAGVLTLDKNSDNLDDITGKVYCYDDNECWDEDTIWRANPNALPSMLFHPPPPPVDGERRYDIINGEVSCIQYDGNTKIFSLVCSEFNLEDATDFAMDDFITLEKNEIFEGNDNQIVLSGKYKGLFQISTFGPTAPSSLDDAPVIRRLHMVGGETDGVFQGVDGTGFIVQARRKHFIVDSCSTSGTISGFESGGICGVLCGGHALIVNSSSSGDVTGAGAGGIVGDSFGRDGNVDDTKVNITGCHSNGTISGYQAGAISGGRLGRNGHGVVTKSYSTGPIAGERTGGVTGGWPGGEGGFVRVEQCYSEGEINGLNSGGISSTGLAWENGMVQITDSYSRGDITGENAGGITGGFVGYDDGTVVITNVYSSGAILGSEAAGIMGGISSDAKDISILMSVHNTGPIVESNDADAGVLTLDKNSDNLDDITGKVYCYDDNECWDEQTIWRAAPDDLPGLQFQAGPSRPPLPCCRLDSNKYLTECDECPDFP